MGPRNIRALDGIRGIAIILVMLHHFVVVLPPQNGVLRFIKTLFEYGWSGVDLFFVLSGFLITGILIDTRTATNYFRAFYVRRVLRIFPLYYAVLIAVFAVATFRVPRPWLAPVAGDGKLYFLYLTNWLALWKGPWGPNLLGHFWSLAVEEQFYLIWAVCAWLLIPSRLAKFAIGGSVIALICRLVWVAHTGPSQAVVMATVTRMDSLFCGALAAIVFRDRAKLEAIRGKLPYIAMVAVFTFAAGVIVAARFSNWERAIFVETYGLTLLAAGFAAFVLHAAVTDDTGTLLQSILGKRTLTRFGKYSYGIYVFHVPILMLCGVLIYRYGGVPIFEKLWVSILYFVFLFGASFYTAKFSYEYFERHFLNLKRFFEPDMSKANGRGQIAEVVQSR